MQGPGSVVLLPAGWSHATLNSADAWGVGRQQAWSQEARLRDVQGVINPRNPYADFGVHQQQHICMLCGGIGALFF